MRKKSADDPVGTFRRPQGDMFCDFDGRRPVLAIAMAEDAERVRAVNNHDIACHAETVRHIEAQAVTLMFTVASLGLITGLLLAP
jgi:hypothetical protein